MEVMTQVLGTETWTRWPTVLRGILGAISEPAHCVVLYTTAPEAERDLLADAAYLLRYVAGERLPVVVACPNAPGSWRNDVRIAGVTRLWIVRRVVPVAPRRVRLEFAEAAGFRQSETERRRQGAAS